MSSRESKDALCVPTKTVEMSVHTVTVGPHYPICGNDPDAVHSEEQIFSAGIRSSQRGEAYDSPLRPGGQRGLSKPIKEPVGIVRRIDPHQYPGFCFKVCSPPFMVRSI